MSDDTRPNKIVAPAPRDRKPRQPGGTRRKSLVKPLEEFLTTTGTLVAVLNPNDGAAIVAGAPRLAAALNNVAKDNADVYRALERMLTGSAWGGVIVAAGAIIVPIMANHNLLPFTLPNGPQWEEINPEPPANSESMPPTIPDIGGGYVPG